MAKKILVVDDDKGILEISKHMLLEQGYEVETAMDGVDAFELLSQHSFDLILLDIRMPGINGQTMFEVIREYMPDVDVIIASVFPVYQQRELFPKAKDYYDKSQGPFVLLDKLANVLL